MSGLLDRRLVLPMPDPLDLTLVGVAPAAAQLSVRPGRAIDLTDGTEIQVATVGPDPLTTSRPRPCGWRRTAAQAALSGPGRAWRVVPFAVRARPGRADREPAPARVDPATTGVRPPIYLGVGGDAAAADQLDVAHATRFLVIGPPRSGRSNVIEVVRAAAGGRHVAVVSAAAHHCCQSPSRIAHVSDQDAGRSSTCDARIRISQSSSMMPTPSRAPTSSEHSASARTRG